MSDYGVGLAPQRADTAGQRLDHWYCCMDDSDAPIHTMCGLIKPRGPLTDDDPEPDCVVCDDLVNNLEVDYCPLGHECP